MKTDGRALRLAKWFDRRRWAILATSLALTLGAGVLAAQLPVRGDFSYLLPPDAPSGSADQLEAKLKDAEARKDAPGTFVSKDGRMQLIVVRTTFEAGAASKGQRVVAGVQRAINDTELQIGPAVVFGLTGDVVSGLAEHDALLKGMLRAALLTSIFVACGLLLYYRSVCAVGALLWSLAVGTVVTFAFTRL